MYPNKILRYREVVTIAHKSHIRYYLHRSSYFQNLSHYYYIPHAIINEDHVLITHLMLLSTKIMLLSNSLCYYPWNLCYYRTCAIIRHVNNSCYYQTHVIIRHLMLLSNKSWYYLKLVLLELSESISDGKFGFSMLKNPLCNFLEQFRQPVAFDSIL